MSELKKMNTEETNAYLLSKLKRYKQMVDHATLQTYAEFDLAHVGMLRSKDSLDAIELEILDDKHDLDENMAIGSIVGMAFPTNDGFIILGNQHSIIVLLDKDFEQQVLLKPLEFKEGVGFEECVGSHDPNDYLFCRAGVTDPVAQGYLEEWFFREAKPVYESKLN